MQKKLLTTFVGVVTLVGVFSAPASAMPIDLQLNVTVRQVCDNVGANCASLGPLGDQFYVNETNKIWEQAGIFINFIIGAQLNSTLLLNGADSVTDFTGAGAGPGTTLYLTNSLVCPSCTLFGEAYIDAGGLVINMSAVNAFNSGNGRLDTIAHELGHNLGIGHTDSNANFLMASGSVRNIPTSIGQICPDAPCRDLLPADQIANARDSRLLVAFTPTVVPEPASLTLLGLGLVGVYVARRRS